MNEIELTKETKVLLIQILKRGKMTRDEAAIITKPFKIILTPEQIQQAIDKL
jgi:hypothetical protein